MIYRTINTIKSLVFISIFFLSGCSKDISELPINEQALKTSSRLSEDIPRDEHRKPLEILNFSGIQPGMTVIDLLGGGGYYSEIFNYIVGKDGKVYLQNNSLFLKFSSEQLRDRLSKNRLENIIRLDSEYADMQLPQGVDLIFVGLSLHDFYVERDDPIISANPDAFYKQVYKSLKPGGSLIIIDHAARPGSKFEDSTSLHRIDEEFVKSKMTSNGFKFESSLDSLRNSNDDYSKDIWDQKVIRKTDRFIHRYTKVE